MIWWLRAHSAIAWAASLAACFLCAPLLSASSIPALSLFSGASGSIPVPLVLPVIPACLLLYGLNRTPEALHLTAVRPIPHWKAGAVAITGIMAVLIALAESAILEFPLGFAVARNLLGYLGIGLLVQWATNAQYGTVAVAAVPVACGVIGLGPGGRPYPWMWPAHASDSLIAGVATALLFFAGMAAEVKNPAGLSRHLRR